MSLILIAGSRGKNDVGAMSHMLDLRYASSVKAAGADAVLATEVPDDITPFDGLLLAGGPDLAPSLYGEQPHPKTTVDADRDAAELALLRAFVDAKKPIFGICRGIQLINVFFGGSLIQDIPEEYGANHMLVTHGVRQLDGSPFGFLGGELTVNSTHHQAVRKLGEGLVCDAVNEQEICEALHHTSLPIWGVQWHPERMTAAERPDGQDDMLPLFKFFAEKCR